MVSSTIKKGSEEGAANERCNDRHRLGQEHLSASWRRRPRRRRAAQASHPQTATVVPGAAFTMFDWHGSLCERSLLGTRAQQARAYGEADESSFRRAVSQESEE